MGTINTIYYGTLNLYDANGDVVSNPTIVTGDVTVRKANKTVANITTLPTVNVNDNRFVDYELSATEMAGTSGQNVCILFADVSGNQWKPITINIPLNKSVENEVWAAPVRALTSGGGSAVAAEIWAYYDRTLTKTANTKEDTVNDDWELTRGEAWVIDCILNIDLSAMGEFDEIWFTYKRFPDKESDTRSLIQITYTDGLLRLNGASVDSGDSDLAAISILDGATGTIRLYVSEVATTQLALFNKPGYYDIAVLRSAYGKKSRKSGSLKLLPEVTRATVKPV